MKWQQMRAPDWVRLALLAAILSGVALRFVNLGGKVYWHDEAYTSLWLSGHRTGDLTRGIFREGEADAVALQKYQHLYPGRGLFWVIYSIAVEDPKHPPLYYSLLWLWAQVAGDSVTTLRLLSALVSLLTLPLAYWVVRELGGSERAGWLAAALLAVSPFHVLYAQETRPYSLWTGMVLASSLALLRALRLKRRRDWLVYAATVALALHVHTLSLLVLIAHTVFVAVIKWRSPQETGPVPAGLVREYVRALCWGVLSFLPWAAVIVLRFGRLRQNTAWVSEDITLRLLMKRWAEGLSGIFVDASQAPAGLLAKRLDDPVLMVLCASVGLVVLYALWDLQRRGRRDTWWFLLALVLVPFLALAVPDMVFGGHRSTVRRFLVPAYLGVHLSVAHWLGRATTGASTVATRARQLMAGALLAAGAISCVMNVPADVTWNKGDGRDLQGAARILNACRRPLVVADTLSGPLPHLCALSYMLDRKVRIRFVRNLQTPGSTAGFSEAYVFSPVELRPRPPGGPGRYGIQAVPASRYLYRMIE